jgi:hypothetical protein
MRSGLRFSNFKSDFNLFVPNNESLNPQPSLKVEEKVEINFGTLKFLK